MSSRRLLFHIFFMILMGASFSIFTMRPTWACSSDTNQEGECNIDRDGDGYTNDFEIMIGTDPDNWDTDGDNVIDSADCDKLNPKAGIPEDCDQIRVVSNFPSALGDLSDPDGDDDQDGVSNGMDNCPTVFNPGQQDQDDNGLGDLCDNKTEFPPGLVYIKGGGGLAGCSLLEGQIPTQGLFIPYFILSVSAAFLQLCRYRNKK